MWTEIPGLLLKFWREVLILSLAVALTLSQLHGRALKAEKELAENNLATYKRLADLAVKAAKAESTNIAKEINDAIPRLVEQAQKDALANYKKRYGMGNVACGIRADGLRVRPGSGDGQADVPGSTDDSESSGVPLTADFLDRAAKAAVMIAGCQKFATDNKLPISKE